MDASRWVKTAEQRVADAAAARATREARLVAGKGNMNEITLGSGSDALTVTLVNHEGARKLLAAAARRWPLAVPVCYFIDGLAEAKLSALAALVATDGGA